MILHDGVTCKVLKDRQEWLANRQRIGGSDAAAIVGLNPYMTNQELYRIKTGQEVHNDLSSLPYVQYGIEAEPHIRALYALDHPKTKVWYQENNIFINDKFPFAHASLDGVLTDEYKRNGILEIKTTTILSLLQRAKWKDRIPDNYYIQVLHYMMVTEFEFVDLRGHLRYEFPDGVKTQICDYHIERSDVINDIEFLVDKEREFWESIKKGREPALLLPEL